MTRLGYIPGTDVYVTMLSRCPSCDTAWAYERNGETYSRIIGVDFHDRVDHWRCPDCSATFPRGSTVAICHCGFPSETRDPDPWEGRLDGYCHDCALARCDTADAVCPNDDRCEYARRLDFGGLQMCGRKAVGVGGIDDTPYCERHIDVIQDETA